MDFNILIDSDKAIRAQFETFPKRYHELILEKITTWTADLKTRVSGSAPSRTGRLRSSIISRVIDRETRIKGLVTVDKDFVKAGALEYGAHRSTHVSGHLRLQTHFFATQIVPERVYVSPYTRIPNIAEHRFMRGSLAGLEPEVVSTLGRLVDQASKDADK